ncbi:MAG: gliding motility-associated C-terminal domain-containing protein [Cyanobacteria bacterium J06649_11]
MRNLYISVLILGLIILGSPCIHGQMDSLVCNGDFIVMHNARFFTIIPDQEANTFTRVPFELNNTPEQTYDAFAYRYVDNSIYGIDYSISPYTRLFRIDQNTNFSIVDTLFNTQDDFLGITAGGITSDDKYLVLVRNTGTEIANLIYLIDLESSAYDIITIEAETTGDNVSIALGDIAIHPETNIGYAYDGYTDRIVTIEPFTGLIDNSSFPSISIPNSSISALAFSPFGELIGHHRWIDGETYFKIDHTTGEIVSTLLLNSPPSGISYIDGCSCPYAVDLEQSVSENIAYPCSDIEVTTKIAFWLEDGQNTLVFENQFPNGMTIEEVVYNPYGGVLSGLGTSTLRIDDFSAARGVDSIVVRITIPDGFPTGIYETQSSLSGVDLTAANDNRTIIFSDFTLTAEKPDPTVFEVRPLDSVSYQTDYDICPGATIDLAPISSGPSIFNFQWFNGLTTPTVNVSEAGTYAVTISNSCTEDILNITVNDIGIDLDLGDQLNLFAGQDAVLRPQIFSSSPISVYLWEASDSSALSCVSCDQTIVFPTLDQTTVSVTAINELGCTASDEITIMVSRPIYAPNVFSPNGDGVNDVFFLQTPEPVNFIAFTIYNRWGGSLFSRKNGVTNLPADGWDGFINGEIVEAGVYIWQIEIERSDNKIDLLSGEVMILP